MIRLNDDDSMSTGENILFGALSFFIPIVGFVLAAVWWSEYHHTAKIALWCSIASVICVILFCILVLGLFAVFLSSVKVVN